MLLPLSSVAFGALGALGQLAEVELSGVDRPRGGTNLFGAFGRDFVTADAKRVMVVAITRKQWSGLVAALDIAPAVAALEQSAPPAMPGRSTQQAIAAGIGWGMKGAIERLVKEARAALGHDADLILTGGWRGAIRDALPTAVDLPDLTLAGIALAAENACAR